MQPIDFASINMEIIDFGPEGQKPLSGFLGWIIGYEADVENVAVFTAVRKGRVPGDSGQFRYRPYKSRHLVPEVILERLFDPAFENFCAFRLCIKYDIAAGDESLDIGKTHRLKQAAKMVHLYRVAANIDGSQKRNVFRHFLECAALTALWSAATCRSFVSVKS